MQVINAERRKLYCGADLDLGLNEDGIESWSVCFVKEIPVDLVVLCEMHCWRGK